MRAAVLLSTILVLSLVAIPRPRLGLYAYVWFSLMRPDVLAFSDGTFPYSLVLAICTLIGSFRYIRFGAEFFRTPIPIGALLLYGAIAASALNAVEQSASMDAF